MTCRARSCGAASCCCSAPGDARLRRIARAHYPDDPDDATLEDVLSHYRELQTRQQSAGTTQASIAEFLDAVAACRSLGARPGDPALWQRIEELDARQGGQPAAVLMAGTRVADRRPEVSIGDALRVMRTLALPSELLSDSCRC